MNKGNALNNILKLEKFTGKSILITGVLWSLTYYLTYSANIGVIAAGMYVIYRLVTKLPRTFKMIKTLDEHLDSLTQQAYKKYCNSP